MAADDSYREEWGKIEKIAGQVSALQERLYGLEGEASQIRSQIADLSYEPDEEGNDANESIRNACYSRLELIQSEIDDVNGMRAAASANACDLAAGYRQQAGEYADKAAHTTQAQSRFQALEGFRFGASTAKAGAALAGQRASHYEDHAAVLNDLAEAAAQAASGNFSGSSSKSIGERGTFYDPKQSISGDTGSSGIKRDKSDTVKADPAKMGIDYRNGSPDFSQVSHAGLYAADKGINGNISARQADAILAGQWGISQDDIGEYRRENDLVWVKNQDMVELIPGGIAREHEKKNILKENEVRLDGKSYYYDDNGYLYRVEDELMPNSGYKLNRYIFKTDEMGRIVSAKGTLHMKNHEGRRPMKDSMDDVGKGDQKKGDDRGHIIGDQFDGPEGIENMIPQDAHINRVDYRNFENELAKEVKDNKKVKADIEVIYEGDSRRPITLAVHYAIDGEEDVRIFPNDWEEKEV